MTSPVAATSGLPHLPAELLGSVPRDVRLTAGGIALASLSIAVGIGALVAGIVMSIVYARSGDERRIREQGSVAVDAEVVQVAVRRGEGPRRVVTYRFDADDRSQTGRTTLRKSDRRVLKQGDPVRIGYLLSRPDESWMIGYEPTGFPLVLIPLTVLSLLATSILLFWNVRRQWTLLSEGRVARARVTATKKVHSDKRRTFRVSYEFQTLSGATQQSRCEVGKAPAIGAIVPIVYHRDQPEWSAMYPLKLVRPGRLVS
jgi:hypothetical protein